MINRERIEKLLARFAEIEAALVQPGALEDLKAYREMTQEHAYLLEIKNAWDKFAAMQKALADNKEMLAVESDPELIALLQEEISEFEKRLPELEHQLEVLLVPPDPEDHLNVIVELRAGTGGEEAALFVANCARMYQLYAVRRGWKFERISSNPTEVGGFREYIFALSGQNVKRMMQYEAGTHRVQRVPVTEAAGRIHTSAITVAVLPEPAEEGEIKLDEQDLRIDTYRASGAGGQHVNVTDSAVRITHIPTGEVCSCQEERSQHKNKEKAMRLLVAKLAERQRRKREEEEAKTRAAQVGSGDRSGRIRTYNFPQNRVTDHRINLTLYNLEYVMEGHLELFSDALVAYYYQQKLAGEQ